MRVLNQRFRRVQLADCVQQDLNIGMEYGVAFGRTKQGNKRINDLRYHVQIQVLVPQHFLHTQAS